MQFDRIRRLRGEKSSSLLHKAWPVPAFSFWVGLFLLVIAGSSQARAADGELLLTVVDDETKEPIICQMQLIDELGRTRHPSRTAAHGEHFVIPGEFLFRLSRGTYHFELQHGFEYLGRKKEGNGFIIVPFSEEAHEVSVRRFVNMADYGWWSGDMAIQRPIKDMELLLEAGDLDFAQVMNWPAERPDISLKKIETMLQTTPQGRVFQAGGGVISTPGATVYCYNMDEPDPSVTMNGFVINGQRARDPEYPSLEQYLSALREKNPDVWVEVDRPYRWDVPTLVANNLIDGIQVAHPGILEDDGAALDPKEGYPCDPHFYPAPWGHARYSLDIYYKLLECGFFLPPSAASGSGDSPHPVGSNRVYAYVVEDRQPTYEEWFDRYRQGRSFITNGPLLLAHVQGESPGAVFYQEEVAPVELEIAFDFHSREPVTYIEIVKNGSVYRSIRVQELEESGGHIPPIEFEESGWFLLRAVTDESDRYNFAMTAPYFVRMGETRRVSRSAAQFFLEWTYERARQIQLDDPAQQESVMAYHRHARDVFANLVETATAE
jgi:hypothetical protein